MILSRQQLEEIAASVTAESGLLRRKGPNRCNPEVIEAIPKKRMATEYLGLEITYAPLSGDGSVCGLTAYMDTEYQCEINGETVILPLKQNQIVLDSVFNQPRQTAAMCARRRFTLAHECAHQILLQLEDDDVQDMCRRQYSERRPYSLRELKVREDWNEWQADVLGAALLMPGDEIRRFMQSRFRPGYRIISYGGNFCRGDRWALQDMCEMMMVSKSAAIIRLRDLGYMEEYTTSLEGII